MSSLLRLFVCLFTVLRPSSMLVYPRDGSAQTIFACCHTEIEVADQTFYLTQSHCTDTRPTSPSADPITPGAGQGSHWSANFEVTGMTRPGKSRRKRDSNPGSSALTQSQYTDTGTTSPSADPIRPGAGQVSIF